MIFGVLTGLMGIAVILGIIMVFLGILTARIFFRVILPIFVVLLIIRLIFAGILMLFNPGFWVFIAIILCAGWFARKMRN